MNEVVGDAVDVPRDADGVDETKENYQPERNPRKKVKHPEEISAVQKGGGDRNCVPARMGKQFGIGCDSFHDDRICFHGDDTFVRGVAKVSSLLAWSLGC